MKPAVKEDGTEYYEYLITHVDNVISVSEDPRSVLQQLAKRFKLKKDKIAAPTDFLGAEVQARHRLLVYQQCQAPWRSHQES